MTTARTRAMPFIYAAALILLWELAVRIGEMPVYILPAPTVIAGAIVQYWSPIWKNGLVTLWTTLAGFGLAVVGGLALGLLVGWSRSIYAGLYPLMVGFNSVPGGPSGVPGDPGYATQLAVWLTGDYHDVRNDGTGKRELLVPPLP